MPIRIPTDFLIFRNKFQPTAAQPVQTSMIEAFAMANVPEPAAIATLLMATTLFARRTRRSAA